MKISECVFVFGSNTYGVHGKGAALTARQLFGAVTGRGYGRTGMSYGIPTKSDPYNPLNLEDIQWSVREFVKYATRYPTETFLVTRVGCGYAGYIDKEIAPLFSGAPDNCILPDGWSKTHRVHHIEAITKADMDKEVW